MQEPNQPDLPPEEPICVCGYSKVGLPETDHPCPECGSTKLAVYQSSFSYYGWILGGFGTWISFVHSVVGAGSLLSSGFLPEIFFDPGCHMRTNRLCCDVAALICTAISMVKREPRRKSVRNIGFALVSGLLFPAALFIALIIDVLVFGGMWTV